MVQPMLLNEEQIQAITHENGPLLVIAGAGTGKTTVITERIKHLITNRHVLLSQIIALTFTEKAALEMEERIDVALPYGYTQMWISTYHSFCDRILRDEAIQIGLNSSYKLVSESELLLFLRKNIFAFNLQYFRPLGNPYKFLSGLIQHFSRLKDEDITVHQYFTFVEDLKKQNDINEDEVKKYTELASAYKTYEDLKIKEGIMDFSDLITNVLKLFRTRTNVLKEYQNRFPYILVDEFQDTNYAQNQLAILLTGKQQNITAVGDDDQAIYRWRGAAISNMIQFKNSFPKAKIVTLTKNYRSTRSILQSSYTLIQNNNPDRLEEKEHINKQLTSERKIKGSQVVLLFSSRVEDEAESVIKKIIDLISTKQYQYKDIAILVRANDHSQPFVRSLMRYNIPYQFLGPGHLFQQEEIKDLLAYLKVLSNFEDSASLYRVLSLPIFKVEARDIAAILNFSRRFNLSLFEGLEKIVLQNDQTQKQELFLDTQTRDSITKIITMIHRHLKLVPRDTAGQILYYFLQDSGLLNTFLVSKSEQDEKKFSNISRFFDKLKTFEATHEDSSVFAVVEWIDLSMQMGESPIAADTDWFDNNAVNILTIHSSKGLEFPIVFIVNLVTQRFPTRERREQIPIPQELIKEILPEGDYHLQEERRLFYVGMTRAKDYLYLTAANYYGDGKRERKISPFVYEALGKDSVDKILHIAKNSPVAVQESLLEWSPRDKINTPIDTLETKNLQPVTYLSYSQIQTFTLCPLHYKLKYIIKIPTPQTASQSFGTSIHSALRIIYQQIIDGTLPLLDDAIEILEENWVKDGYKSKNHEHSALKHAKEVLTTYLTTNIYNQELRPQILGLEVPFQFYIKNATSGQNNFQNVLKIGGRIDRIDRIDDVKIEILDYKTGNNLPLEKELKNDLQLNVYALAATHIRDQILNKQPNDVLLSLYYLEKNKKFTTVRSREQLEAAKSQIFDVAKQIATSSFVCSGSSFCSDCEYKMLCAIH